MTVYDTHLPDGFQPLEPFVARWALETAEERHRARLASSEAERASFFAVASERLAAGLDHLDKIPLARFSAEDTRLMRLFLSLAHVSLAVELQDMDEAAHAQLARHMTITRAPADV